MTRNEGGGSVIFQQCGAQNFNGHQGCGKSGAGTTGTGLRGGICERKSEIMRTVNEDQTVKEINPHINMSPEESPCLLSFSFSLPLSLLPPFFHRNPLLLIRPATLAQGESCTYFTFICCHRLCLFTSSSGYLFLKIF